MAVKGVKGKGAKRAAEDDNKKVTKRAKVSKKLPSPPSEDEKEIVSDEEEDDLDISEESEEESSSGDELDISESEDELDNLDEEEEKGEEEEEEDVETKEVDPNKKTSAEQHSEQRKLLAERKLQRKSGAEVQKIKSLWEKLRVTKPTPPKAKRDELCDEIWELAKDVINDLVLKHDASRVVQTLVKYSNKERRDIIVNSLKGSFYQLATSAYGKYLLIKLLHYGSKESRAIIVDELHGKLRKLMRHREGAYVVEDLYVLYSTGEQRQQMIREFWGSQYAVFRDSGKGKTVLDVAGELAEKKQLLMSNLYGTIKASVEKGSTGFQILHAAMKEYVTILISDIDANESAIRDFIDLLAEQFAELVHTQEGSEVACNLIALANAKERKTIIKSLKTHTNELIKNEYGNIVLITLFMTVDDTVLIFKSFGSEIFTKELVPELIQDKFSRRPILYLLKGLAGKYFAPNVKKAILGYEELAYKKTSKKDKEQRKLELLEKSIVPLYKAISDEETINQLLSLNMAAQVIAELILTPTIVAEVNDKLRPQLVDIIFDKTISGDVLEDYHLLNKTPFVSRLVKSLIQGNEFAFDNESKKLVKTGNEAIPGVGTKFAERVAGEINVNDWISGQPAFVLVSVVEVLQLAKSSKVDKLKKSIKKLTLSKDDKGAKLLSTVI
ncbi:Pumilio y domain family member 6 [Candida viswanathii]|uniref:Pumilio y domain family member 6 n=1 Tax=Candida viswanathii TaxID=5486 RepID=A0A367XPK8_9ASCO|nr:Pumilio y domain family member 6 [Candida viswanathii]